MAIGDYYNANVCPDKFGCPPDRCPDFIIKRQDTMPIFKTLIEDCNGAMDLTDENLVVEVNIWFNAKLKYFLDSETDYFEFADGIGFEQAMVGDVIVMERSRLPERMLIIGFDENNKLVQVQRGYQNTNISSWKKGTKMKIFRTSGASASIESVLGDVLQEDGTTLSDQLLETYLNYEWSVKDTCTSGCFWLEFKLLKMIEEDEDISMQAVSYTDISFTSSDMSAEDFGCILGSGVEWIRRFPVDSDGFLIKIINTMTSE